MRSVAGLARVAVVSATRRMLLLVVGAAVSTLWPAAAAQASLVLPGFTESQQYLIIARMQINGNQDVSTNNFELGANKAPVPSTDNFLDGGLTGGPTLLGAVPTLPANAAAVLQGVTNDGNIALTDPRGALHLQNTGVYAQRNVGIRFAAPNETFNQSSNVFFNDPNLFPNTFDTGSQTGFTVDAVDQGDASPFADVLTRVDPSGGGNPSDNTGVTYGFDHSALISELAATRTAINRLDSTGTLDVSAGNAGLLEMGSTMTGAGFSTVLNGFTTAGVDATITLASGLNVIDIVTGDNSFLINGSNLVIDGPADAFAIFRLPGLDDMLLSQANILVGDGGIGLNNVMFYTDQEESGTHFSLQNSIINGVAFYSLSDEGGTINIDNAQGCTQLVADIINLNDVRFIRSSFIPAPSSGLVILAGASLLSRRRRRSGGKRG